MFLAASCLITQLVPAQLDWYQIDGGSLHLSCGVQVQTNLVRSCCWVAEMGLLWYIDVGKGPRRNCMVLCTQTCAAITSKLRYRRCSVLCSHMYWHKLHKPSTLELKGLAAADGKLRISRAVLDPQWSTERSGFLHLERDRTRTCIFRKQLARPQCQGVQACMPEAPVCHMVCFCSSPSWHLILFSAFTGEAHYWFRSIFDRTCLCPWGPQKYCSADAWCSYCHEPISQVLKLSFVWFLAHPGFGLEEPTSSGTRMHATRAFCIQWPCFGGGATVSHGWTLGLWCV